MSISALSPTPAYYSSTSTSNASVVANANSVDSSTEFLTPNDISTEERLHGMSSLAALEADPYGLRGLQDLNNFRKNGVQGDITTFVPEANLTSSDAALLEKMTGTTTLAAAAVSSPDAILLVMNISQDRQDGSLTGDVSTGYLQNLLSTSLQLEKIGRYGEFVSSTFLQEAIADVENASGQSSGSAVNMTA